MYRELTHAHRGALLQAFTFTTSTPNATVGNGTDDVASAAAASAGKAALTLRETGVFKRGPVLVGSHGADVAGGGYAIINTLPASNVLTCELLGAGGAGDDGTGYALSFGWRMSATDTGSPQLVKATFPRPVLVPVYITNNGSISVVTGLDGVTAVRNSQGNVTVYFKPACANGMAAVAAAVNTTAYTAKIASLTGVSVNVITYDTASALVDTAFVLLVALSKSRDLYGRGRSNVLVPLRSPRIIAGRVTTTIGVPAVTIGGTAGGVDVTVTDNGLGDYTLTFAKPFRRAPVVIPTGLAGRAQLKSAASVSAATIVTFNAAGAAADDSFDFIAIGSDASY